MNSSNFKKENIVKIISEKKGFSLNFSKKLVNDILLTLIDQIKKDKLFLKNLGSFKLINKKERKGRNPITKEEHIITARKTIKFTPSKKLDKLNE